MICTANWERIDELLPPTGKTVLLYQQGDLYPVVGFRNHGYLETRDDGVEDYYILEEGGPEDGEHRKYPLLAHFKATHWCELPQTPLA